ncbi:hypothetical protein [Amniculibacterium aquaticum]|uniref:hypothetical protein n=1 Tax=Amniculibacterium aquaticum TaxID=2479858 RepID=UPI000F5A51A8|nr:hypothetical protein [Amniculibacterium aquaticum]
MKKTIFTTILLVCVTLNIVISCHRDDSKEITQNDILNNSIVTNRIKPIENENIETNGDTIKVKSSPNFLINGTIINLSSYSFIKKNDILSFLDKKYSLDFSSEELYVKTPFYEGSLSGINESLLQKDTNLIVMLLVNDYLHTAKFPKTTDINEVPSCSFWNTV